jgi:N-methylhydantoinase A/oxoprolinase/acetone carboxylase beta subunit
LLIKDISNNPRYTPEEKALCRVLREKPLPITEAAEAAGKDIYSLPIHRLIKDGIVQLCGLTPTDVMHIKGDFTAYDKKASQLAAAFAAYNLDIGTAELCNEAYEAVKRKLYLHIVKALLENRYDDYMKLGVNGDAVRFINDAYESAKNGTRDALLTAIVQTDYTLVGIGAPVRLFLEDVAAMLGTRSVFPKHYEVANALGAVFASVSASFSVEINPINDAMGTSGYTVYGISENKVFTRLDDAVNYAAEVAVEGAKIEALKRGATGKLTVTKDIMTNEAEARDCLIYLGTTVTAKAVGSIGLKL